MEDRMEKKTLEETGKNSTGVLHACACPKCILNEVLRTCDRVRVWMYEYSYSLMIGLLQQKARLPEQGRETGTDRRQRIYFLRNI